MKNSIGPDKLIEIQKLWQQTYSLTTIEVKNTGVRECL